VSPESGELIFQGETRKVSPLLPSSMEKTDEDRV
jgi:hypothetical protein